MFFTKDIVELNSILRLQNKVTDSIGFVPTMGCLHKGHVALINASKSDNHFTVVSIFVNPSQFNCNKDFSTYPRDVESDLEICKINGVDLVFAPTIKQIYPDGYSTSIDVEGISSILCGKFRPGHFKGVATIVAKLFNIVQPHNAYFGQKDAQQVAIIKKMVSDLNMNVKIMVCPTVREPDGLAMSSRNKLLSPEQRNSSVIISMSLFEAKKIILDGETSKIKVLDYIKNRINSVNIGAIDYVEILNADTFEDILTLDRSVLIAVAVKFGNVRLIDNIVVTI